MAAKLNMVASKTLVYSFESTVAEVSVQMNYDVFQERDSAIPLDTFERERFGLGMGMNPWKHLGVPDTIVNKLLKATPAPAPAPGPVPTPVPVPAPVSISAPFQSQSLGSSGRGEENPWDSIFRSLGDLDEDFLPRMAPASGKAMPQAQATAQSQSQSQSQLPRTTSSAAAKRKLDCPVDDGRGAASKTLRSISKDSILSDRSLDGTTAASAPSFVRPTCARPVPKQARQPSKQPASFPPPPPAPAPPLQFSQQIQQQQQQQQQQQSAYFQLGGFEFDLDTQLV